ncbi:MAG TPA: phospholipid carrier-dependent glycosyltransferase [Acidobacteriota bacterium]
MNETKQCVKAKPEKIAPSRKLICLLFCLALVLRLNGLGRIGLSADEYNKLEASNSYRHGYYSVNSEHPMLLKLLVTGSVTVSEKWNAVAARLQPRSDKYQISIEGAVRFPAAVFGAATAVAMVYLGALLVTPAVGWCAGFLWATDINVISVNRVAKEETLAVFFLVLTFFFFMRGKAQARQDGEARRDYFLGAACIGLLLGSWYLVIVLFPLMLYYSILQRRPGGWTIERMMGLKIMMIALGTFLIINPTVLSPENIAHIQDTILHRISSHHGYYMMGRVFPNKAYYTFWGVPFYFYFLYLGAKVPLITLAAFLIGFLSLVLRKDRNDRQLLILVWFLSWSVVLMMPGGKFVRYVLTLMPVFVLIVAYGVMAAFAYLYHSILRRPHPQYLYAVPVMTLMTFSYLFNPLALAFSQFPHYGVYLNEVASGLVGSGALFPHCEYYDAGVREAMEYICRHAPPGAVVGSEVMELSHFYSSRLGRKDLKYVRLSQIYEARVARRQKISVDYFLVQDGRKYFENVRQFEYLQTSRRPAYEYRIHGGAAVSVYKGDPEINRRLFLLPSARPQDTWTLYDGMTYQSRKF